MLTTKLTLERFDKDGRLLEKREQPSRSFLLQFIQLLYCAHAMITDLAPEVMTDIDAVARDVDGRGTLHQYPRASKANFKLGASGGNIGDYCFHGHGDAAGDTYLNPDACTIAGNKIGIQIGTGVVAIAPNDTALGTRIAHGRAGGQMEYGGCELVNLAFAGANGSFDIRRYFTNLSGGGITVEEVGLYMIGTKYSFVRASWCFCAARDLTGGVAVADTELLRVTYTPQTTV